MIFNALRLTRFTGKWGIWMDISGWYHFTVRLCIYFVLFTVRASPFGDGFGERGMMNNRPCCWRRTIRLMRGGVNKLNNEFRCIRFISWNIYYANHQWLNQNRYIRKNIIYTNVIGMKKSNLSIKRANKIFFLKFRFSNKDEKNFLISKGFGEGWNNFIIMASRII